MPIFSLVPTSCRERLTSVMAPTYWKLAQIDPRKRRDALLVRSDRSGRRLLGYVNADDIAVALSVAKEFPVAGFRFRGADVPRTPLIEAAIDVVDGTLRAEGSTRRVSTTP